MYTAYSEALARARELAELDDLTEEESAEVKWLFDCIDIDEDEFFALAARWGGEYGEWWEERENGLREYDNQVSI